MPTKSPLEFCTGEPSIPGKHAISANKMDAICKQASKIEHEMPSNNGSQQANEHFCIYVKDHLSLAVGGTLKPVWEAREEREPHVKREWLLRMA